MTRTIFTIIAVISFVLAAFGVAATHVALVPVGLAFYAARDLVEDKK